MPYVVTTKRPVEVAGGFYSQPDHVSRRAVATLVEAKMWATGIVESQHDFTERDRVEARVSISLLSESGGTVGPLPDGTVIEVEQTTWYAVWFHACLPGTVFASAVAGDERAQRKTLDAFNARSES